MDLLVSTSFIASFFAGFAALFAPCCITVLLPTYLASVFREKSKVFLMTFVFFLGLLVVFLPLGLGASMLSQFFSRYHNIIFSVGAVFLIFLGTSLLLGFNLSLPFTVHPQLKKYDFTSVFVLGVFSAVATTCCAPVLAGVLALSVLPGSVVLGAAYTLTYVLGMVIPLFFIAVFLDRIDFTSEFFIFRKTVSYSVLARKIRLTVSSLFSGIIFLFMGILILYLSQTNQLASHSSYQIAVNIYLTKFIDFIAVFTKIIPEPIWALIFTGLFLFILKLAIGQLLLIFKKGNNYET